MDAHRNFRAAVADPRNSDCPVGDYLIEARRRLRRSGLFTGHEDAIRLKLIGRRLVLTGRVPSFYLKQVLQATLRDLPGVDRVQNDVDVVNCAGLSSEPRHHADGAAPALTVVDLRRVPRRAITPAARPTEKGARS